LQYLNTDGFGHRYVGNAEEENYVSLGDNVLVFDELNPEHFQGVGGVVEVDGTLLLPEVGAVHVAGLTRSQLQAYLTQIYSPYYDETDIQVQISTEGKKFYIYGEVAQEGERTLEGDVTVFEVVMAAKPNDNTANLGRVRVIRADPVDPLIIIVPVTDMLKSGDSTFNIHVQERDIIFVPPTVLAELGYFVDTLLFPVKQVIRGLSEAFGRGFYRGGANPFGTIF